MDKSNRKQEPANKTENRKKKEALEQRFKESIIRNADGFAKAISTGIRVSLYDSGNGRLKAITDEIHPIPLQESE